VYEVIIDGFKRLDIFGNNQSKLICSFTEKGRIQDKDDFSWNTLFDLGYVGMNLISDPPFTTMIFLR